MVGLWVIGGPPLSTVQLDWLRSSSSSVGMSSTYDSREPSAPSKFSSTEAYRAAIKKSTFNVKRLVSNACRTFRLPAEAAGTINVERAIKSKANQSCLVTHGQTAHDRASLPPRTFSISLRHTHAVVEAFGKSLFKSIYVEVRRLFRPSVHTGLSTHRSNETKPKGDPFHTHTRKIFSDSPNPSGNVLRHIPNIPQNILKKLPRKAEITPHTIQSTLPALLHALLPRPQLRHPLVQLVQLSQLAKLLPKLLGAPADPLLRLIQSGAPPFHLILTLPSTIILTILITPNAELPSARKMATAATLHRIKLR